MHWKKEGMESSIMDYTIIINFPYLVVNSSATEICFFFAISHRNVFYHVNLSWSSLLSCTGSHYPTKIGCIMAITHVVFFFWHEFTCWNLQLSHVSKIYIILIFKRFCLLSQSICFLGKLLKLFVCVVNYFYDE